AELRALADQRDAVSASIAQLRDQLGQALETVGRGAPVALPPVKAAVIDVMPAEVALEEPEAEPEAEVEPERMSPSATEEHEATASDLVAEAEAAEEEDEEMPWPAAFRPVDDTTKEE